MASIGNRLKEIRTHLGMTQEEFGRKLGIMRSTLGKHEGGHSFPTGKMLKILAEEYNISMDYLICGRGDSMFYEKEKENNSDLLNSLDNETLQMLSLMTNLPMVRYSVLGYFQCFQVENKALIEKALADHSNTND